MANEYVEAIIKTDGGYPEKDFASSAREHFDDPNELCRISSTLR